MFSIGSASLKIVPTFDGLTSKVNSALNGASGTASSAGQKLGQSTASGFSSGLAKSGAVVGAFSAITTSAMSAISSSLSGAISRFDTLNNYPTVMQTLGYSASDAESSISKMSERLQGLPTSLDSMTSTVQGIVATTGDLEQATDAGLALNDMLLASGSSTQLTNAAMEQFRQILSKGKPDMQDWKSLTSAMPGQMNQLAQAMLGAGATASDLYTALGGGGADATISTNELLDAMIRLDTEGGDGITSFAEQAKTATGGVETSMANLQNAVTRGLANTLSAVGKENIAGVFTELKTAVDSAFTSINSVISSVMPTVQSAFSVIKSNASSLTAGIATFGGLTVAGNALSGMFGNLSREAQLTVTSGFSKMKSGASGLADSLALIKSQTGGVRQGLSAIGSDFKTMGSGLKTVASGLLSAINPVALAVTGVTAVVSAMVASYVDGEEKAENLAKATSGLNDVVSRSAGLKSYSSAISDVGTSSGTAAKSIVELNEYIAASVDTMNETTASAEKSTATLNSAERIISEYAGKTDLSTQAQGKLEWALEKVNEQFGLSLTTTDVANNAYDQNGEHVDNLKTKIQELIEEKKNSLRVDALTDNLSELYNDQAEAAKTVADAQANYDSALSRHDELVAQYTAQTGDAKQAEETFAQTVAGAKAKLDGSQSVYDRINGSISSLENELGNASTTTTDLGNALSGLASDKMALVEAALSNNGQSLSDLSSALDQLGVSADDLSGLTSNDLTSMANAFDGSAASIAGKLGEMCGNLDDAKLAAAETAKGLKDAFSEAGIEDAIESTGITVDDFAEKCEKAGLKAEDFSGVSSDAFTELYNGSDGIDDVIAKMALFNSTPLVGKDGTVNIDDNELIDAQGNVLTWNGTALVDKASGATVDATSVTDSTGTVWEWNGTALTSKSADATIYGNAVTGDAAGNADNAQDAINRLSDRTVSAQVNGNASDGTAATNIWNTVGAIGSMVGKTITNVVNTITQNAAGGIRPHADGGIRLHADGAIATKAMPLDIVGEAGAEAIVPLTNKRYSAPFAKTLAEQMGGNGYAQLASWLASNLPTIIAENAPNLVIDNDAGRLIVDNRLYQLQRKAAMNRG